MKKYIIASLFARLVLGGVFIYAGIYKIMNPQLFEKALINYNLFPNAITRFIAITFPWVELSLGALLISGILLRYAALATIILLLIFIIITVISLLKGNVLNCGCFPESSILNSKNPLVLIIRNCIFIALSIVIIVIKIGIESQPLISNKEHASYISFILIAIVSASLLFGMNANKSYEKSYVSYVYKERNKFIQEMEKPDNKYLIGSDISATYNIIFPRKPKAKIIVMLTLHSLDCRICIDEAIYLEYLNIKYGDTICFCAVVGMIGNAAISNFKHMFSITYPIIQNPSILNSKIFYRYKSVKTIISEKHEILRIEAITYNVKEIRNEYENILMKYIK